MVYRIFVEKKDGFDNEAKALLSDCKELLELNVERVRVINRYDVEDIDHYILNSKETTRLNIQQILTNR